MNARLATLARSTLTLPLIAAVVVAVAAYLHHRTGLRYPVPITDEARFILPARALLEEHTLDVRILHAPDGIFWMPHGYYVVLAGFGWIFGLTLRAARWASFVMLVGFYLSLSVVATRVHPNWKRLCIFATASSFMLSSLALRAGNQARMESLVLCLIGLALVAFVLDAYVGGFASLLLACVVHPIAIPVVGIAAIVLVVRRRQYRVRRWEWIVLGLITVVVVAQSVYFVANLDLVREHLRVQLDRKGGSPFDRSRMIAIAELVALTGAAILARGLLACSLRATLLVASAAGLLGYIAFTGYEWSYGVYVYGAIPVLVLTALVEAVGPSNGDTVGASERDRIGHYGSVA